MAAGSTSRPARTAAPWTKPKPGSRANSGRRSRRSSWPIRQNCARMAVPVSLVITHIMVGMRISSSRLRRIATAVLASAAVVLVSPLSVTPAAAMAATATAITTTEGTQTVAYGGSVAISGTLVRASDKAPLQDGRVYLQQDINGVWTNAGSVVTN